MIKEERNNEKIDETTKLLELLERKIRYAEREGKSVRPLSSIEEEVLWLLNERGRLSTREISRGMKIKPDVLSHILGRLQGFEKKGKKISLIKREIDEDDMRGRYITMTNVGKKFLLKNLKIRSKELPHILNVNKLTVKEQANFSKLLKKMLA